MTKTIVNTTDILVVFLVVITCIGVLVYHNYWRNSNEEFATSTCGEGNTAVIKNLVIPYFYDKVPNTSVSPETQQRYEQAQIPKDRTVTGYKTTPANSVSGKVNEPVGIATVTKQPVPLTKQPVPLTKQQVPLTKQPVPSNTNRGFITDDGVNVYKDLIFTGIYSKTSKNMADRVGGDLLASERQGFENSFKNALTKHHKENNINEYFRILLANARNGGLLGKQTGQGAFELMIYTQFLMLNFIDLINKHKGIEITRKEDILQIRKWINKVVNHCSKKFENRGNNKIYIYATAQLLNLFIEYKYYPTNSNYSTLISKMNKVNDKIEQRLQADILSNGYMKPELMRCSRAFSYHIYSLNSLMRFLEVLKGIKTYAALRNVSYDYAGTDKKLFALINRVTYKNESEKKILVANMEAAVQEQANIGMTEIRKANNNDPKRYEKLLHYREYKNCCSIPEYKCDKFYKQIAVKTNPNYKEIFEYLYNKRAGNKSNVEKIISGSP